MGFHRLTTPTYAGGLRVGDDYINNAGGGTPAPADTVLAGGTYIGSYFFADGQVTTAAINRAHKALAANDDFLDDAIVQQKLDYIAADAVVTAAFIAADGVVSTAFAAADTAQNVALANTAPAGDLLIGSAAKVSPLSGGPFDLSLGTVASQLTSIVAFINNQNRVRYVSATATLDDTGFVDYAIYFTSTNFPFTLTAPAANVGRCILLVDVGGLFDPAAMISLVATASTIEGSATYPLTQRYGKWLLYCDGATWHLFRAGSDRLIPQYMSGPATIAVLDTAEIVMVNTTGGAVTATLPAHSGNTNRVIRFKDYVGTLSTNALTLARNGGTGKIEGVTADFVFEAAWGKLSLMSNGIDWVFV